ncbi:MAG: hypothetical protein BroJett040_02040 [Oligoflexia bacterium]|nr:MAG: hypothetical protein BroJett040_02040 [Oligoflexia bacterium]
MKFYSLILVGLLMSQFAFAGDDTRNQTNKLTAEEAGYAISEFAGEAAGEFADVIRELFKKHGQPAAIILGKEAQGSFFVGYKKGKGKIMFHGQSLQTGQSIEWAAPSVGINVGGSVSKVAILVYGAQSKESLKQRFTSIEGSYHIVAGASLSYLTNQMDSDEHAGRTDEKIDLAYVTVGVGLDAGVAVGSLKFK